MHIRVHVCVCVQVTPRVLIGSYVTVSHVEVTRENKSTTTCDAGKNSSIARVSSNREEFIRFLGAEKSCLDIATKLLPEADESSPVHPEN